MNHRIVPIAEEHIAGFHAALGIVAREKQYLAFIDAPPIERVADFIRANIAGDVAQFVAVGDDGTVIGWCDVLPGRPDTVHAHEGKLGIGLVPEARGRGIGAELMRTTIDAARARGLTRIALTVWATNARAIALYERLGFVREGLFRAAIRVDGTHRDLLGMALVPDAL